MLNLPIQSVIQHIDSAELSLTLTPENGLNVKPASGITPALRELLRFNKSRLVDFLLETNAEPPTEPFVEPRGYEGTGWRLAGAENFSPETLSKFYSSSLALDGSMQKTKRNLKIMEHNESMSARNFAQIKFY